VQSTIVAAWDRKPPLKRDTAIARSESGQSPCGELRNGDLEETKEEREDAREVDSNGKHVRSPPFSLKKQRNRSYKYESQ